ncbi:MAG: hypothetical protein Ta2A_20510 [Treponemataceae bacterium]|nr:MAG: hypothetical protein Ta2A_20510 [Treponemataceae bacterium]
MAKKDNLFYASYMLIILVTLPARFATGIVSFVFFNLLVLCATLFVHLIFVMHLDNFRNLLSIYFSVMFTVIFKQILIFVSPSIALLTGFPLFVVAFVAYSIIRFDSIHDTIGDSIKSTGDGTASGKSKSGAAPELLSVTLKRNMKKAIQFSLVFLAVFLVRDAIGNGTVSFPLPFGIFSIDIPFSEYMPVSAFWVSIPGALVITLLFLCITLLAAKNGGKNSLDKGVKNGESTKNGGEK